MPLLWHGLLTMPLALTEGLQEVFRRPSVGQSDMVGRPCHVTTTDSFAYLENKRRGRRSSSELAATAITLVTWLTEGHPKEQHHEPNGRTAHRDGRGGRILQGSRHLSGASFGFGDSPAALIVIDMAYGWTDDAYAGGSAAPGRAPVAAIRELLPAARSKGVPRHPTPTSPYSDKPQLKSAADFSPNYRRWDRRACEIDERLRPLPDEYIIYKEHASAFAGTALIGHLVERRVDTLLITGCSTSACVRATATDAKSLGLRPVIIREAVQDRCEAAHEWTLFDIQARFADVVGLDEALAYLKS